MFMISYTVISRLYRSILPCLASRELLPFQFTFFPIFLFLVFFYLLFGVVHLLYASYLTYPSSYTLMCARLKDINIRSRECDTDFGEKKIMKQKEQFQGY